MEPENLTDYILCECALDALRQFTAELAVHQSIDLVKPPAICLTMVRAEDSVEQQEFYLGEALTTDCEVAIAGHVGYGICLGDEPDRAWCMAVIDALIAGNGPQRSQIDAFLDQQLALVRQAQQTEFGQILRTKVDFKLMEQA
jgi:alpha-D-ribose 1-methylphosphonate 5-triphosphate synthase subunit PhnG